ncbi:MAG: hypothetical protein ACUVR0_01195 [Candidatus Aminicenantales bacterium]
MRKKTALLVGAKKKIGSLFFSSVPLFSLAIPSLPTWVWWRAGSSAR